MQKLCITYFLKVSHKLCKINCRTIQIGAHCKRSLESQRSEECLLRESCMKFIGYCWHKFVGFRTQFKQIIKKEYVFSVWVDNVEQLNFCTHLLRVINISDKIRCWWNTKLLKILCANCQFEPNFKQAIFYCHTRGLTIISFKRRGRKEYTRHIILSRASLSDNFFNQDSFPAGGSFRMPLIPEIHYTLLGGAWDIKLVVRVVLSCGLMNPEKVFNARSSHNITRHHRLTDCTDC